MIIKSNEANQKNVWPMNIKEYKINTNFSWALIKINWDHWKIKCLHEDRIYYIINWKWQFIINWIENIVSKEDVIYIPRNTPYNIIWEIEFFLICSPEFKVGDDIHLD